jgi:RHH-type transcriptional regulator, rel operon repressor / antitoxin RelB
MTYLSIPNELDKRLTLMAAQAHLEKDDYVLQLLEESLEDQEDYLIAAARLERLEKGLDKTLSYEEVVKELGLELDVH